VHHLESRSVRPVQARSREHRQVVQPAGYKYPTLPGPAEQDWLYHAGKDVASPCGTTEPSPTKVLVGLTAHAEIGRENPDSANDHRKKQRSVGLRVSHEYEGCDADSEQESGAAHTARLVLGSAGDVSGVVLVGGLGVHGAGM
jgi:hypothetical protein